MTDWTTRHWDVGRVFSCPPRGEGCLWVTWLTCGEALLDSCFPISSFLLCFLFSLPLEFYHWKHFRGWNWVGWEPQCPGDGQKFETDSMWGGWGPQTDPWVISSSHDRMLWASRSGLLARKGRDALRGRDSHWSFIHPEDTDILLGATSSFTCSGQVCVWGFQGVWSIGVVERTQVWGQT